MSFGDDDEHPWWDDLDEDVSDDVRRILEEREEDDESEDVAEDTETEEQEKEFEDIEDAIEISEFEDDPHNAPDNQAEDDWELVYHFDFGGDAVNYCANVVVGPLWIVWNEDGSADVYVDRDYEGASV